MEPRLVGRAVGKVVSNVQQFLNSDQHRVVLQDGKVGFVRQGTLFIEDAGVLNAQWKEWERFTEAAHLIYTAFAAYEFDEVRNITFVGMQGDRALFDFEVVD